MQPAGGAQAGASTRNEGRSDLLDRSPNGRRRWLREAERIHAARPSERTGLPTRATIAASMGISRIRAAWHQLTSFGRISFGSNARVGAGVVIDAGKGQISFGHDAKIQRGAMVQAYGGRIDIGDRFSLNPYSILYGHGGLTIGDNVRIAAHVTIVPFNHIFEDPVTPIKQQGESRLGVSIGDDVWIGTGAIVLDGVNVASGCVIGAGAVVTKSTEVNGVYVGSPARLLRYRGG